MRYIMTIVWAIIISTVLSYVLTSMEGEPFVLSEALILGVIFSIIVIVLGEFVLKEKKEQ
ncbi:membrane protein CcdC involved in cytochrome C biogenesis [Virgibacillus natechei]|uniref:Membrane protein CcdC involved in cytochrome C biogenesis n=1 Tax=Virgibacillus natechei TaxID=1216297 RepID=A0ABS4IDL3_9BACI|nr:YjzD family protein [Virgibacillus natechei]MBP1969029.1 membrane protein CcdC involved in cytochrome C biogenesis [Virgibacillus natechei]UZD14303.1 YjzD family protein [Virgibacillus natechei]